MSIKGVHRSVLVGFVLKPNLIRSVRVGENGTLHRPIRNGGFDGLSLNGWQSDFGQSH